jgi:hypothetical protein
MTSSRVNFTLYPFYVQSYKEKRIKNHVLYLNFYETVLRIGSKDLLNMVVIEPDL